MTVIIPNKVNGLNKIIENLDSIDQTYLEKNLRSQKITLFFPKFKIENKFNLIKSLKEVC